MYEKKRFLMKTVFETARNELPHASENSISIYLSSLFEERYGFSRDERSYGRYYKNLVKKNKDYNIDDIALDYLSKYVGYDNFNDFCENVSIQGEDATTIFGLSFKDISDKVQHIIITVSPTVLLPDFMKKNGLGILEIAFLLCLVTGNVLFSGNKKIGSYSSHLGFMSTMAPMTEKKYMYWNGERYIGTDSSYIRPGIDIVAMDVHKLLHFRKIMRKDTLTELNALGKTWYSKYNNEVEFFTDDGVDPDNGRELRKTSPVIIFKYAGKPYDSLVVEE